MERIDFTNLDVAAVLAKAEGTRVDSLDYHRQAILDRLKNPRQATGFTTPWSRVNEKLRLRKGELSILGAYNGDGKTTVSSMMALHIAQGTKVGIASLEMEVADIGDMLCKQFALTDVPTNAVQNQFLDWSAGRIFVYDRLDVIQPEDALACLYSMAERGCEFLVLDSLMMVGVTEDNEDCRRFVTTLAALAKKLQVHIMLIHHSKKPAQASGKFDPMPTKYSLLGSSHLSNIAHTILIWWCNREVKEKIEFGESTTEPEYLLHVAKQRFGTFEGKLGFWSHKGRCFSSTSRGDLNPVCVSAAA